MNRPPPPAVSTAKLSIPQAIGRSSSATKPSPLDPSLLAESPTASPPDSSPTQSPSSKISRLDLTDDDLKSLDVSFDEIDDDLLRFHSDATVKQALVDGVDLNNYTKHIEQELTQAETDCITDYLNQSLSLTSLQQQIVQCDRLLASMQTVLTRFQSDLGAISDDIRHLQSRSQSMAVSVNNRREAEKALSSFIQNIYISIDHATAIISGELNESYVHHLHILNQRLVFLQTTFADKKRAHISRLHAIREVIVPITRLKLKAISRIRIFLLDRFYALCKPKTNVQIKQKLLLKYRYFYEFLLLHTDPNIYNKIEYSYIPTHLRLSSDADIAHEIRTQYHITMSAIYLSKFRAYLMEMNKLINENEVKREERISDEECWVRTNGLFSIKRSNMEMTRAFMLNGRDTQLLLYNINNDNSNTSNNQQNQQHDTMSSTLIIPHILDRTGHRLPFERVFSSALSLLMDTATSEYEFIVEFFDERMSVDIDRVGATEIAHYHEEKERQSNNNHNNSITITTEPPRLDDEHHHHRFTQHNGTTNTRDRDRALFLAVFNATFTLYLEWIDLYINKTYDTLSILILIRILCQDNLQMQHRHVHCLDAIFDRMNMMLWPRFKYLYDLQVQSLSKQTYYELKTNIKLTQQSTPPNITGAIGGGGGGGGGSSIMSSASSVGNLSGSPSTTAYSIHRPLFVSLRYAHFAAALHTLNRGYNDDILIQNTRRLRTEIEKLLLRSASRITIPKLQIITLINNYNAILRILQQHHNTNTLHTTSANMMSPGSGTMSSLSTTATVSSAADDIAHWFNRLNGQITLFVEEELSEKFSRFITFVKSTESMINAEERHRLNAQSADPLTDIQPQKARDNTTQVIDVNTLDSIVKHFAKYWKDGIEAIHQSVNLHFNQQDTDIAVNTPAPSPSSSAQQNNNSQMRFNGGADGIEILKTVLVQLVLYYQRFQDILKRYGRGRIKDVVPTSTIMFEIRRYTVTGNNPRT